MRKFINLDANASYGPLPALKPSSILDSDYLNPSSIHRGGQRAKAAIELARDRVRELVGSDSALKVIFTSGATEALNLALNFPPEVARGRTIVSTTIEHPAVLAALQRFEKFGGVVRWVAPGRNWEFSEAPFLNALAEKPLLVNLMCVNNETGQLLPVAEISQALRSAGYRGLVLSDAVQAAGKLDLSFAGLGADMLALSGHKIGALPGVGALVVGNRTDLEPLVVGGPQEGRLRAGTENVPGIISFGQAAEYVRQNLAHRLARYAALRDTLEREISARFPDTIINCANTERVANTSSLTFPGVNADDLVVALDLAGIGISSGSACASGKPEPSHVLLAGGLAPATARSTVRLSFTAEAADDELAYCIEKLGDAVERLRGAA
ncbi:MAG: cysteine desulfurase [Oligoflexia bacterium]|nr:cysteine desulfurase [Oligoflexia bacterium]